jgi:kynurenine formamidase
VTTDDISARIDAAARRLSNWGRWGAEDELGTLNHITAERRRAAAQLITSGETYSLAFELRSDRPQPAGSGRMNPQHYLTESGSDASVRGNEVAWADDVISMSVHATTHWDALSHVFHRGWMYNERPASLVTSAGAAKNDIRPASRMLAGRAVLVDVAAHHSVDALATSHEITSSEIEAALDRQATTLCPGDILLVRTGHLGRIQKTGDWDQFTEVDGVNPNEPGIGLGCLDWIQDRQIAAVACDNWGVEHTAGAETTRLAVHEVGLAHMGLLLGEVFQLDELALACAADGRYECFFSGAPLPIRGGVGGLVNPMVIR